MISVTKRQNTTPGYRRLTALAAVALPLVSGMVFFTPAVRAQESAAPTNFDPIPSNTELIPGQDKTGPYILAWKKLPPPVGQFKPTVSVDTKELREDAYTWDAANGTITFAEPLKAASMARVEYHYDPKGSERNPNPSAAPVNLRVLGAGKTQLQLTALPGGVAGNKTRAGEENDTLMVWKLAGAPLGLLGGGLTTQAFFAPDVRTDDEDDHSLLGRSAFSLGYKMGNDKNGIDAGFSRYGQEFAPTVGKAMQLANTAQQARSLAARYSVAPWLRAEWKQSDTDYLADNAGRTAYEQMALRLGGTATLPTMNLFRTTEGNTNGAGATTSKTTDRMELAAKIGPQVGVNGTVQQVQTEAPSGQAGNKTTDIALQVQAQSSNKSQSAAVAVTTNAAQNGPTDQAHSDVSLTLQPSPSVTITAEQKKEAVKTTSADGKEQTAEKEKKTANAKIALAPGTTLSGGVATQSGNDPNVKSGLQATSVAATIGQGKAIELQQTMVTRDGDVTGNATLDTTDTRLSLRPLPGLTLSGALTQNPERDGQITASKRQEMGLKAKVGALELGSGYALTEMATQSGLQTGEWSVSLGLRFNQYTTFSGEYKDGLMYGMTAETASIARGLRVYSLGLNHAFGSALNFSLGGSMAQDKTPNGVPQDYKAEAKLSVKL